MAGTTWRKEEGIKMQPQEEAEMVQSFLYEKKGNSAVVWRCFSRDTKAVVPKELGGLPVVRVAPYGFSAHGDEEELWRKFSTGALRLSDSLLFDGQEDIRKLPALCGNRLEELVLPSTVTGIGRYCFYNCDNLRRLSFTGGLGDWGSGVFTGCHHIQEIRLRVGPEGISYLKDVLDEVREELMVDYVEESGGGQGERLTARLMFPEFYEEGVENTPARILETHVHGSGLMYRNCFQNRKLDFRQYDTLFPHAKAQEPEEFLIRMVLGRLRLPHQLTQAAREQYEGYAREHQREFARYLTDSRDTEGIRWMLELLGDKGEAFVSQVTEQAGRKKYAEALSLVMEYRRRQGRGAGKRRRLEL